MHLPAGHKRTSLRQAGALACLFILFAGCGEETSTPTVPTSSQETETGSAPPALAPLPAELVGTWTVSASSGSQQIVRRYVFTPEGRYEYTLGQCLSSTDCNIVAQESGYAQAANGVLSLEPQTEPNDGSRAWPYVVFPDPTFGDIQLHLTLPDGQDDIFYFGE